MRGPRLLLVAFVVALEAFGCTVARGPAAPARTSWVVVAPHPDDEALIAAGALARAVENGERVAVVVMTNGDYDCVHDGLAREAESIAGLAALGVAESDVYFLGYPDGALASLGRTPLPAVRRRIGGACARGSTTYGARGALRADVHTGHFRAPAVYTRASVVEDLALVLEELRPSNIVVTHPADTHPDHGATYGLLRDSLDRVSFVPRVHRAVVHNGDCWPNGLEPREPCAETRIDPRSPTAPMTGRLAGYIPRERIPVPESCRPPDPTRNRKLRAIAAHASQTRGTLTSYLFGFARSDEVFFPETYERTGRRLRRSGRTDAAITSSASIAMRTGEDVATLGLAAGREGAYLLELDAGRVEARLSKTQDGRARLLAVWPLPHDAFRGGVAEDVELVLEPRPEDGNVAEITFRFRGAFAGGAVDVSASPTDRRGP